MWSGLRVVTMTPRYSADVPVVNVARTPFGVATRPCFSTCALDMTLHEYCPTLQSDSSDCSIFGRSQEKKVGDSPFSRNSLRSRSHMSLPTWSKTRMRPTTEPDGTETLRRSPRICVAEGVRTMVPRSRSLFDGWCARSQSMPCARRHRAMKGPTTPSPTTRNLPSFLLMSVMMRSCSASAVVCSSRPARSRRFLPPACSARLLSFTPRATPRATRCLSSGTRALSSSVTASFPESSVVTCPTLSSSMMARNAYVSLCSPRAAWDSRSSLAYSASSGSTFGGTSFASSGFGADVGSDGGVGGLSPLIPYGQ
mmetsp:Transcript_2991/g.9325  ORF Transcript_2991/g.9325 Transcript_2991/m.9325 type:complete len:311 (-) Transcript_2991:18-950(-)